jgi:hypothetical protein
LIEKGYGQKLGAVTFWSENSTDFLGFSNWKKVWGESRYPHPRGQLSTVVFTQHWKTCE